MAQEPAVRAPLVTCLAVVAALAIPASTHARRSGPQRIDGRAGSAGDHVRADAVRLTTHTVRSGGRDRSYAVYLPRTLDGAQPRPVVLDIHGTGSRPVEELSISGLAAAAEERGFAVLLPVALAGQPDGRSEWNVPPDPRRPADDRYLLDLLDDASRRLGLDAARVFVAGFSGGARLASRFASRHPDRVAALAAVGGLRAPAGDGPAVPVISFHGSADPINPYRGGGPEYWGEGVEHAARGWVDRNRCGGDGPESRVAPSAWTRTWLGCNEDAEVTLVRFEGGHVWPGSRFQFPLERFGPAPGGIDATARIVEFFERHGLLAAARSKGAAPDGEPRPCLPEAGMSYGASTTASAESVPFDSRPTAKIV